MISHLRLAGHPEINDLTLGDLGHVNAVVGRNNSGKSTLLRTIASGNNVSVGFPFNDELASALREQAVNRYRLQGDQRLRGIFVEAIRAAQSDMPIVYEGAASELSAAIITHVHRRVDRGLSSDPLLEVFKRRAPVLKSIFIPPQRRLDCMVEISTGSKPQPTGEGVLNELFRRANSAPGSHDYLWYHHFLDVFRQISDGFSIGIHVKDSNRIALEFSTNNKRWSPASQCGLGLQDVLVILFQVENNKNFLVLLEEPEDHIHPGMQRRLLEHVASKTELQFIISTHSNVFLDSTYVDHLILTRYSGKILVEDCTSRARLLSDLGYSISDNLVSDVVVLCEGPTDVPVLQEYLRKLKVWGRFNVRVLPMGGDIMDQIDLEVFSERARVMALIDRDDKSSKVRGRFVSKCNKLGIDVHWLRRYSIESYFSPRALRSVLGEACVESGFTVDPRTKLENQLGFRVKGNNRRIAKEMTLEELHDTDLMDFLLAVKGRCEDA